MEMNSGGSTLSMKKKKAVKFSSSSNSIVSLSSEGDGTSNDLLQQGSEIDNKDNNDTNYQSKVKRIQANNRYWVFFVLFFLASVVENWQYVTLPRSNHLQGSSSGLSTSQSSSYGKLHSMITKESESKSEESSEESSEEENKEEKGESGKNSNKEGLVVDDKLKLKDTKEKSKKSHQSSPKLDSFPKGQNDEFIMENAHRYLERLSAFGTRVTGSKSNEMTTPLWLQDEIETLINKRGDNKHKDVLIEYDFQHPTSSFYLDFLGGITNIYKEVTNVIVKVSWPGKTTNKHGILINAHFDSVPGSPGTSDDGVGVAVMLEIIRAITSSDSTPLDYPVFFLFNGAEEWNHQAAHGFITKHTTWSPEVQYILNLEAIGAGGREVMFQCNSGYLAKLYGKVVPYPYASVLAHEMFKYFLYQFASTDWMTLLKYGKHSHMRGLDTAYTMNGYVYHTTFDNIHAVPNGTIQNTGDNMLHLIQGLADNHIKSTIIPTSIEDSSDISDNELISDEYAVFFDIYASYLIVYSGHTVTFIHCVIVAFAIYTIYYMLTHTTSTTSLTSSSIRWRQLWYESVKDEGYCLAMSSLTVVLCSVITWLFLPMRWYDGGIATMYVLYFPPLLLVRFTTQGEIATKPYSTPILRQIGCLSHYLLLAIPLIVLRVMSAFVFCIWALALTCSLWVYFLTKKYIEEPLRLIAVKNSDHAKGQPGQYNHGKEQGLYVLCNDTITCNTGVTGGGGVTAVGYHVPFYCTADFFYVISLLPMVLIHQRINHSLFDMLVPLLGKSGTVAPSDLVLALAFAFTHSLATGAMTVNEIRRPLDKRFVQRGVCIIALLYVGIALLDVSNGNSTTSHGYSDAHPKRLWMHHLERRYQYKKHDKTNNKDSITGKVKMLSNAQTHTLPSQSDYEYISDRGLWVLGFDSQGLRPLLPYMRQYLQRQGKGRDSQDKALRQAQSITECDVSNGDCYLAFPWYFPVAEVMRDSLYIPMEDSSKYEGLGGMKGGTKTEEVMNIASYEEMTLTIHEHILSSSTTRKKLLEIIITGPSHIHIVLRESKREKVITRWYLDEEELYSSLSTSAITKGGTGKYTSIPHGTLESITVDQVLPRLTNVPLTRSEGIHVMEVGFGLCSAHQTSCQKRIWVEVGSEKVGSESLEVITYGHYVDKTDDAILKDFVEVLPIWSKGSEWTKFPTILISETVNI